jgi:hypothetical protein
MGEKMRTQIGDSRFREVHRGKIRLDGPLLNKLQTTLDIGFDPDCGTDSYRDSRAALANGRQGCRYVPSSQGLFSIGTSGVNMQRLRTCCDDQLCIMSQFLWGKRQCWMFARSTTSGQSPAAFRQGLVSVLHRNSL